MKVLSSKYRCALLIAVCLIACLPSVHAQPPAQYEEYMQATVNLGRFNGYVLVARDGKPVFSQGYGMANFEDDVANSSKTKFRIASVTKTFTAVAIMMLQERGKLSASEPVCKYLRNCAERWKPLTIRHLLSHTSGIPDYIASPDFMRTISMATTPDAIINSVRSGPLQFEPGSGFAYSNSNYIVLGRIIEIVAKQPYAAFIKSNILAPLGMKDTGYDDNSTLLKHRAIGYLGQPGSMISARYMDMSNAYAAGGLYSTAEDLLRWDQALLTERILKKSSIDEIFTPGKGGVGYGWFVNRQTGGLVQMQSGLNSGFASAIYRYPEEKVSIILLSNLEDSAAHLGRIGHDLAAITFGEKYELPRANVEIKVDAKAIEKYVGQYEFGPGRIINISRQEDRLFSQRGNEPAFEMFAESDTKYFFKGADVRFEFQLDAAGKVTGVILRANGQDMPGKKIK